ncbi:chloride channel protein [Limosilactobacillus panis]|uniref:chloride channel protein n=1 Tax=Limosilactobacillus panis TaxID=47493 RepID=UPI0025A3EA8E|nr:chloride channel protein [Limosilactobacillus panis]
MRRYQFLTNLYLLICALSIGALTGLYLNVINFVIHLVWKSLPTWLSIPAEWQAVAIIMPSSILIGLAQKYVGAYPLTIAQILGEVRVQGHFSYQNWWKILFMALLILGAGASIGPEASASGLVAGMVYWLGSRYKLLRDQAPVNSAKSLASQLQAIIFTRLSHGQQLRPISTYFSSRRQRQAFYLGWTLVGLVGFFSYFHFFPQEGVIGFHHPPLHWQWQAILVVVPALVVGWGSGFGFVKVSRISERWLGDTKWPLLKAIGGGLLLGLGARFSPAILFSGEFSIVPFAHHSLAMSPLFLITLAIVKTVVTNFGFALGWRGGTIFPAIFSSLATGAALAQAFPWMPRLTATLVVATAITIILEKPLVSAAILILLLPIQLSPFIILTCFATNWLVDKHPQLKP